MRHSRRDIGHRHGGVSLPAGYAAPARPLDSLSAAATSALRAAWWTRPLLTSFGAGTVRDATHLYDQSGNSRDIVCASAVATGNEGTGRELVETFDMNVPDIFARQDRLGLAADPALTIAWRMRASAASTGTFPAPWALGSGAAPILNPAELNCFVETGVDLFGNPKPWDILFVYDFDGSAYVGWTKLRLGVTHGWHNYVLTKPAGGGWADTWRLYIDGVSQGVPDDVLPGALDISAGTGHFILGSFSGGTTPFDGPMSGAVVWERELSGTDLLLATWL